jgi:hypothetical protein
MPWMNPCTMELRTRTLSRLLITLMMCGSVLLPACQQPPDSYYPLTERLRWEYVFSAREDATAHASARTISNQVLTITNLPRRQMNGAEVTPQMGDVAGQQWFLFVKGGPLGIAVVAKQPMDGNEPVTLEDPSYLLQYPLRVGTTWDGSADTSLLKDHQVSLQAKSTIEATDETVTVPAGTFKHCVKVTTTATEATRIPGVFGKVTVDLRTTQWFAAGTGVVKAIQTEHTDPPSLGGGEMTLELKSLRRF